MHIHKYLIESNYVCMQNVRNDLSQDAKLGRQKIFFQMFFFFNPICNCLLAWNGMEGRFVWLDYATNRLKSPDE